MQKYLYELPSNIRMKTKEKIAVKQFKKSEMVGSMEKEDRFEEQIKATLFYFGDIIVDTGHNFYTNWRTSIKGRRCNWIVIKENMKFKEALAEQGKIIYKVLSGQRRFKNSKGKFEVVY